MSPQFLDLSGAGTVAVRPKVFRAYDLDELGLLPADWQQQVLRVAETRSRHVFMEGECSTTLDFEVSNGGMEYDVVTGEVIREELPWLWHLYVTKLTEFATETTGTPMKPSKFPKSAINVNILSGTRARYEWHVDSNSLTGLIFVTDHPHGDGGELAFDVDGVKMAIPPRSGEMLIFDATEMPHAVFPLTRETKRLTIPMNFYYLDEDEEATRPPDLDRYLYGED
jgi:hypothetical protein